MSLLDTASLLLTPNAYKEGKLYSVIPSDGSGDFTFTRATTATRVNSDGLVELVPYNLLSYSEEVQNAYWIKTTNSASWQGTGSAPVITANYGIAPNGTMTADRVQLNLNGGTTSNDRSGYYASITVASPSTYGCSIYIKPLNGESISAIMINPVGLLAAAGAETSQSYEALADGWYRITRVATTASTIGTFRIQIFGNNGLNSLDCLIWGAQLVEGTNALPYQKTETRLNIPRIDSSLGGCPSILLEPQRTNLALQSSSFDSATWVSSNSIVVANYAISPSGIQDADLFYPSSTGTGRRRTQAITVVNGTTYTSFCYVKAAGFSWIRMTDVNAAGSSVWFDVSNGEVGTIVGTLTPSITDVGNGWYRCSVTSTASSTSGIFYLALADINGTATATASGTNGLFLWGAQLEAGAYATSYIPTTTASVTRNLETVVKTGATALIGQTEGTLFVDFYADGRANASTRCIVYLTNNTDTGNRVALQFNTSGQIQAIASSLGSTQGNIVHTFIGQAKAAFVYSATNYELYINGSSIGTFTGSLPNALNRIDVGSPISSLTNIDGRIKAVALWKERLTNDQLAQLTTI